MNTKRIRYYYYLLTITLTAILLYYDSALSADRYVISILHEKITENLKNDNRISEYTIEIYTGRVYSVMKIPKDWAIKTKDSEIPQLEAYAFHGAGFLSTSDIKKGIFEEFIVIETEFTKLNDLKINIKFTIDIFMKEDEKHITIDNNDLIIKPYMVMGETT